MVLSVLRLTMLGDEIPLRLACSGDALAGVGDAGNGDAEKTWDVIVGADQVLRVEGIHVVGEENSGGVGKFRMSFGIVGD